jgi:hypothetical protein
MTQYIGSITVILETETPELASETLRSFAQQLDDTHPAVVFADHNGDVDDYEQIERECEESLAGQGKPPLLTVLLASLEQCAVLLADYEEHPGEEGIAYRAAMAAIAEAKNAGIPSNPIPAKPPSRFEIEHDPAENSDRVYVLVDGKFDVAIIRTGEGVVVDVYPKDGFDTVATTYAYDSDVEQESSTNCERN